MIEALTIINTIAIIGFILLQIAIFRSGKPKMDHLTQWMNKQEGLNKKLIESVNNLSIHKDIQKNEIEMLFERKREE